MNGWLDQLAAVVGDQALTKEETGAILRLARDVAHGVERKFAPLSTYLVGVAVGRLAAGGLDRAEAFRQVMAAAGSTVPDASPDDGTATGDRPAR